MIAVEIFGRDLKVDEALRDYVNAKASKLDRYINSVEEARVDLTYRKSARDASERYKAQITLRGKGFVLRAEERADQIHAAFDATVDIIQRQIERYKGKHYRGRGDGKSFADDAIQAVEAAYQEEKATGIARRKKFLLHPMDEAEAVEQMKLLGHEDFFIFYNMEAACTSVLYRRNDGSYGLINTELA